MTEAQPGKVRVVPSDARRAADAVSQDRLASEPLGAILESLSMTYGPEPIVLDLNDRWFESRDAKVTLYYPFFGTSKGLGPHAEWIKQWSSKPRIAGAPGPTETTAEVVFTALNTSNPDFEKALAQDIAQLDAAMTEAAAAANKAISAQQASFIEEARAALTPRVRTIHAIRGGMALANVPMQRSTGPRVEVPLRPTELSMSLIEQAAANGASEFTLADSMADSVMTTIAAFSRALERLPGTASKLLESDEESIRDVLLFVLNANFQGAVTGETFISEGKADLLLRWRDRDAFVGECKIWKGQAELSRGVDQLLDRYTLWRQTRVALVVFFRGGSDITKRIDSANAMLAGHPRVTRTIDASEPYRKAEYEVQASGDELRPARLTFLPVVIPA